ncbi:MAG: hypothetical protein FJZ75_03340 [Bacteroidetes bacterium]|nr:hypothetical protein [Bacteroidota bacterium]
MRRPIACCIVLLGFTSLLWNQTGQGYLAGIKGHQIDPGKTLWVWSEQVLRVHQNDTLFFDQSFLQTGNIHSIDLYNPLKVLVFFKDQSQLLWVDNRGAALSTAINLMDMQLEQASVVSSGYDNGLWVVTGQDMTLIRLNQHLKVEFKVPNLHRLTQDPQAEIAWMMEHQNRLYLVSTTGCISIWDIFGGLISVHRMGVFSETTELHRRATGVLLQNEDQEIEFFTNPSRPVEVKKRNPEQQVFFVDKQKDTYKWHSNPVKK